MRRRRVIPAESWPSDVGGLFSLRPSVQASDGSHTFAVRELDLESDETILQAVMTFPDTTGKVPGDGFNPDGYTSVLLTDDRGRQVSGGRIVGWTPAGTENAFLATIEAGKLPSDASTLFITPLREVQVAPIALPRDRPVTVETSIGPVTISPPQFDADKTVVSVTGDFATYRGQAMQTFSLWWRTGNGMDACPAPQVVPAAGNPGRLSLVLPHLDPSRTYELGITRFVPAGDLEVKVKVGQ
ncbi:hypothetical protein GCM10010885_03090 [Alicyclobacillus cellulosilyticus]|uniref:Uncharacterized protein n=1 Tax=Alicyclobacillus cellulosilyticus TaxID=1003997 RepID=A0A917NF16_9BACL|nr:hypothetical protein [Alicyclobacillus cellulosilyticus]GGI96849.1 hypothetical protein GCM10010885_03090 [Alicyclobacillus cellulosilyticus]